MTSSNRRQFLKLFSAAFVMKALSDKAFCRQSSSYFESDTLGLKFVVPRDWYAMDGISVLTKVDKQVLTRHDPESISATPLMVFTRYEEPTPLMNPSIGLFVDALESWMGDLSSFADASFEHYSSSLSNPKHELRPKPVLLSNHLWQNSIMTFDFVGASGFRHRVRMRSFLTFLRGNLVMLNLTDSENGPERATKEFSAIEPSVIIRGET
jgi:hypothetical protein